MKSTIIKYPILLTLLALTSFAFTQADTKSQEFYELNRLMHPLLTGRNAAGIGLANIVPHGVTEFGYRTEKGNYHRAQEGNATGGLRFYSERYDSIAPNWVSWGSFEFLMDREENRRWSDVINTYNNNPYLFGSSVPANYDSQMFDFKAKISSAYDSQFNFGVGIDYKVGDLSRLRDPRTRVFLADYAILPSVVYRPDKNNILGINLMARFQKEKMPNVTTVQDDPDLAYYTFFGMENADAVRSGYKGFQRQFVSRFAGIDGQYEYQTNKLKASLQLGGFFQHQEILENIKQSPGSFRSLNYHADAAVTVKQNSSLLHAGLKAKMQQGAANEYLQELITTRDTLTGIASQEWITLYTYKNRYSSSNYDVSVFADLRNLSNDEKDFSRMLGVEAGISGFSNAYNLPYSQMTINRLKAGIYGHYRIFSKSTQSVNLKGNLSYEVPLNNSLTVYPVNLTAPVEGDGSFRKGSYDIQKEVITPDFNYYNLQTLRIALNSYYNFLLPVKKLKVNAYIRLHGHSTISNASQSRTGGGIAIGIRP
jgi:hypothetical protein